MEKKALNLHAEKLRDLVKDIGIGKAVKGVKRVDQTAHALESTPKPALVKSDIISSVVEKNPDEMKHKLVEDMMERGTTSLVDLPISAVRSLPGVSKVWDDKAHGNLLYSYQKPLMDADKRMGEALTTKVPFLKKMFTERDMEPILNVKTKGGETVHGYVPVDTARLTAPIDKFKRMATPLLAVLGVAKASDWLKPKKEEQPEQEQQFASLEEEYRQELINKIAASFATEVAPSSMRGVERHVRIGITNSLDVPFVANKITGSTPSKRDAVEHAMALRRQVDTMREVESTMRDPRARMSARSGIVENLNHAEVLDHLPLSEKTKLVPSKKLPSPAVDLTTAQVGPKITEGLTTEFKRPALSLVKKSEELSNKEALLKLARELLYQDVNGAQVSRGSFKMVKDMMTRSSVPGMGLTQQNINSKLQDVRGLAVETEKRLASNAPGTVWRNIEGEVQKGRLNSIERLQAPIEGKSIPDKHVFKPNKPVIQVDKSKMAEDASDEVDKDAASLVHDVDIPKIVTNPVIANHPGASKPPPDLETVKRITSKMEGIDDPQVQKFVAAKKQQLANASSPSPHVPIHIPVKKTPDGHLVSIASEESLNLEVVAMEQEKMREASAMLKAAADRIRDLQHEITKSASENKKLTLQLIAKERSGRAVKLAQDMVSRGMLKRAQLDEEVDRIMDMNDDSFDLLHKAVKNVSLRKEASSNSSDSLDTLTGLVAPSDDNSPNERPSFRDALSSFS